MSKTVTNSKGATSYKETTFGVIPRIKLLKLEIEGTKRGLEYLYDIVNQKKVIEITPELILKLHNISFGWIFPNWAGKYRTIQVTFSGKEAPAYFRLPELVINLCYDLKERIRHLPKPDEDNFIVSLVQLLAWFQHRVVSIHPFKDYNGRIAHMLTILLLLRFNLPPIELKAETGTDRRRYLTSMQKADEGDYSDLEVLISQALTESLEKMRS